MAEEKKQEEAVNPLENFKVETPKDDIKKAEQSMEPEKQESKPEDAKAQEEVKKEENTEPPKKSRSQRRIEKQNQEIKNLKAELEAKQESKPKEVKEEAKEPNAEDFEEFDDYEEALKKFEEKKVKPKEEVKPKADARIANMQKDGREQHKDFDKLVSAKDFPLTQEVLNEVLETDVPADVLYHLANNKKLAKKIADLDKKGIQRELIKIELKLEEKPTKEVKVTKAPEPINPLNGGTETVRTLETTKSYNEYERLRNQTKNQKW